jgi:hypothetical protein
MSKPQKWDSFVVTIGMIFLAIVIYTYWRSMN